MSSKSKRRPTQNQTIGKAIDNALTLFLWAYLTVHGDDRDEVERMRLEIANVRDSVIKGALTIPQLRKAIKDEYGWEI